MELISETLDHSDCEAAAYSAEVAQIAATPGSERRREPRFPTNWFTVIHLTGDLGAKRTFCRILDVSENGMRVRTDHPIAPETEIRVILRDKEAVGKVRYCHSVSDAFDHGIQVEEVRSTPVVA